MIRFTNSQLAQAYDQVTRPTYSLCPSTLNPKWRRAQKKQHDLITETLPNIAVIFNEDRNLEDLITRGFKLDTLHILELILTHGEEFARETFYQEQSHASIVVDKSSHWTSLEYS